MERVEREQKRFCRLLLSFPYRDTIHLDDLGDFRT